MAIPNKSPLKILEKIKRGRIQGLPIFWVPPIISEMNKATDFKFVGTFIGWIGTKAHEKFWK